MTGCFSYLDDAGIEVVISALENGRLVAPYSPLQVSRVLSSSIADSVQRDLYDLEGAGFDESQIVKVLLIVLENRTIGERNSTPIDLVTSGPDAPGITNRDTSVVVRELFTHATSSVVLVGFAVHQGRQIFEALASKMEELPDLSVRFFLNIERGYRDKTLSKVLVSQFRDRFVNEQWPEGCRLPEIYYYPRSLEMDYSMRASLHAKCIVVDGKRVFISSANFTEAAQDKNIEVGLEIEDERLAASLTGHFEQLAEHELLKNLIFY